MTLVGFVDASRHDSFLSHPVLPPEAVSGWEFDAVLLTDFDRSTGHRTKLRERQVPDSKIIALTPSM